MGQALAAVSAQDAGVLHSLRLPLTGAAAMKGAVRSHFLEGNPSRAVSEEGCSPRLSLGGCFGKSGSTTVQSSSVTSGFGMAAGYSIMGFYWGH